MQTWSAFVKCPKYHPQTFRGSSLDTQHLIQVKEVTNMSGKAKLAVGLQQKGSRMRALSKRRKASGEANEWICEEMQDEIDHYMKENLDQLMELMMNTDVWKNKDSSLDAMNNEIQEVTKANKELKQRLAITEGRLTRAEKEIDSLKDRVVDLTTRSMRENLVFKNVPEEEQENAQKIKDKVMTFLSTSLKIDENEIEKVMIERIHCVGKKEVGRNRKVIAKMTSTGKDVVMNHIKNLAKDSEIKISQQFPPEVHARRDKLWRQFINAKEAKQYPKWNVDQLQIGQRTVKAPKDTVRDLNLDQTERAMELEAKHTHVITKDKSHFQGHVVDIKTVDDVIPALKSLQKDTRVSGATHVMYAYRVGNDRYSIQNWEDDGEWGGARKIMEEIQKGEVYNRLVCVTRWYGGQNIGAARFHTISELAASALTLTPVKEDDSWNTEL